MGETAKRIKDHIEKEFKDIYGNLLEDMLNGVYTELEVREELVNTYNELVSFVKGAHFAGGITDSERKELISVAADQHTFYCDL